LRAGGSLRGRAPATPPWPLALLFARCSYPRALISDSAEPRRLKIDRSFVRGLPGSAEGATIARLIVAMAKALRMETVAEGVETREQAVFLEAIGCGSAQGFLFSRGVAPEAIAALLDRDLREPPARPTNASRAPSELSPALT
jgi:EAL domain